MAIQLGSAYGKVGLDVSGLLSGVFKGKQGLMNLAQVGEQVGGAMKRAGQMMTVGVTLPILAMGAASIKAASDFEETKNKAVVVFGEMSDSVVTNANRSGAALGVSKTQYLDYASSIGAALKAGGMGVKESTALAEQAVKHFADLASFHNWQVEEVAAAWQSAIRGQYEPIQKYFPFITDAYLKTYGIANGLVDASTEKLKSIAQSSGLDVAAFESCLASGKHRAYIQQSIDEATRLGLSGTPAFLINGRFLSGAQPFEAFVSLIEEELALARANEDKSKPRQ